MKYDILISQLNNAYTVRSLAKSKHWKEVGKDLFVDGQTGIVFKRIGETVDQATASLLRNANRIAGVKVNGNQGLTYPAKVLYYIDTGAKSVDRLT